MSPYFSELGRLTISGHPPPKPPSP
jgi:hypothetical protein